jgi:hypothetical protein
MLGDGEDFAEEKVASEAKSKAEGLLDKIKLPCLSRSADDQEALLDERGATDDIVDRVLTQRQLEKEEADQDKAKQDAEDEGTELGWKHRLVWKLSMYRVLKVTDDQKMTLWRRLKDQRDNYLFFNNLATTAILFWKNTVNWTDCCQTGSPPGATSDSFLASVCQITRRSQLHLAG